MRNMNLRHGVLLGGIIILVVLIGVYFGVYKNDESSSDGSPVVTIKNGTLQGEWIRGAAGGDFKFAAFRGVPYAQPPIEKLRFKGPRPPQGWKGTKKFTKEGNSCYQAGDFGDEDCLYLNVYTPKLPTDQVHPALPVYVFIHGGIFQYGNGNMDDLGPHFLVEKGIVVVTLNYRLNVLAHLCLDTDDVPGNADLKDQVQALRWVQENIESFGGDPTKVTLGGQSSGGVSASWLTILPATNGLIRSALTQSGTAVSSWSYTTKNIEFGKEVYKHLTGKVTNDLEEIAQTVIAAKAKDLLDAAEAATLTLQANQSLGTDITFFHLPCIERRDQGKEEKLITKDPESYIIQNETRHVPLLLGETKREWTTFYVISDNFKDEKRLEKAIDHLITLVPCTIVPGIDTQKILGLLSKIVSLDVNPYVKEVRDYYFDKNTDPDCQENRCKMAKYLDHVYIMTDTSRLMQLRSKYSSEPTYGYVFNLKTDLNSNTSSYPTYLQASVVHGDDLAYIWHKSGRNYDYNGDSTASVGLRRMVTMVTNFIKEGNPTPKKDELITEIWRPVRQNDAQTFMEITENLTQRDSSMEGKDNELWSRIFSEIRDNKSP